jgi:hypothetical protein
MQRLKWAHSGHDVELSVMVALQIQKTILLQAQFDKCKSWAWYESRESRLYGAIYQTKSGKERQNQSPTFRQ